MFVIHFDRIGGLVEIKPVLPRYTPFEVEGFAHGPQFLGKMKFRPMRGQMMEKEKAAGFRVSKDGFSGIRSVFWPQNTNMSGLRCRFHRQRQALPQLEVQPLDILKNSFECG